MLENWLDNSCKRYVSLLLPFLCPLPCVLIKLENGLLRISWNRYQRYFLWIKRLLDMNAVFTYRYECTTSSKAILIHMFVISGWMGTPSELSPWFGVHGWIVRHCCGCGASSWFFQTVDDHRGACTLPNWPLAGMRLLDYCIWKVPFGFVDRFIAMSMQLLLPLPLFWMACDWHSACFI